MGLKFFRGAGTGYKNLRGDAFVRERGFTLTTGPHRRIPNLALNHGINPEEECPEFLGPTTATQHEARQALNPPRLVFVVLK